MRKTNISRHKQENRREGGIERERDKDSEREGQRERRETKSQRGRDRERDKRKNESERGGAYYTYNKTTGSVWQGQNDKKQPLQSLESYKHGEWRQL